MKVIPNISKGAWRYFAGFFKNYYHKLILTSIGSTAQAGLIIPVLLLVRYIFDVAIPQKEINNFILIGIAILILRLSNAAFTLFLRNINIKIIAEAINELRTDLMLKIYNLSRTFHTNEDQRVLHTRIVQDTERIYRMSESLVSGIVPAILISIGLCGVLFVLNWYLFTIILMYFPVLIISNRYMGRIVKKKVFAYQRAFESFSKDTMYIMKFLDLIKIQSAGQSELQKHKDDLDQLKEKSIKRTYFFSVNGQVQGFLVNITGIIVMIVGGVSVAREVMSLGDFFAFYMAANYLQNYFNTITGSYAKILTGNESLETLFAIANNQELEPYSGTKIIDFKGRILFNNVSFKYTEKPVLHDISFSIEQGNRMAIIGENGAGKSTIINLILGFYAPQKGSVYADDNLYDEIDFQYYRKFIGVVSQHPLLIPGTISENIKYGYKNVSDYEVLDVSRKALAHNFVKDLKLGYDTQIGEDGVLLSGGERQRIAIARALLRKPKLLILDEPTNHLDITSVKEIMQSIDNIDYNPAILIISHDMAVVNHAQKIFVLNEGYLKPWHKTEIINQTSN
ncbi:MAG: ABC transporter ATP-binding protein [Bacteroidota bacterium]|nr:ABC transporter ATP-binding protein [Bacteroidota bacterium]